MKEVLSAVFGTMGSHEGRVILILRAPLSFKLMEAWEYSSYPTAKWRQVPASESSERLYQQNRIKLFYGPSQWSGGYLLFLRDKTFYWAKMRQMNPKEIYSR